MSDQYLASGASNTSFKAHQLIFKEKDCLHNKNIFFSDQRLHKKTDNDP